MLPYLSDKISTDFFQDKFISIFLEGLTESNRFKNQYEAIAIPVDNVYILTFARRDWVEKYQKVGVAFPIS